VYFGAESNTSPDNPREELPLSGLRASLPVELASFIGRERELSMARELLHQFRLLTLTGVGGSGKTRLALELASELETDFERAALFVDLAPLSNPAFIPQAVVQALGLVETTRLSAEEALLGVLRESEMLLLVDNCEHLIGGCSALIERLLRACPNVRVLATSREPLDIRGEVTLSVPPLSLPALDRLWSTEDLAASEAIRLFEDRAAASRPEFHIDDSNAQTVFRVCHSVDGLPLAIELAAVRIRSMSPDEILERLDDRFALLGRATGAAVPRHQTLRATIDWSHDLLTDPERVLFRRLSVFAGGWRLEDAEVVCFDEDLPRASIMELHSRLVERSLVVADALQPGRARHRFLETIRGYAVEHLDDAGEVPALQRRHFEHFLALAETYHEHRMTRGSDAGLPGLAAHRDNFRAALAWGSTSDSEGALRLSSALDDFWRMISAAEGWEWLQRTLPSSSEESPHRVRALLAAGMLSAYVPAYAEGAGLLREALSAARHLGDRASEAWAELWLGRLALFKDDSLEAEQHLERALGAHEDMGNPLGTVRSLALLGFLQSLILRRTAEGEEKLERAAALARATGDGWGEGYAHMMLGLCAAEAQDVERTVLHCGIALRVPSLGPLLGIPLQALAAVTVERDPAEATRLLGGAAGHLERTGTLEPAFLRRRAEATRQRAEELIGVEAAARSVEEGRRMTSDEVMARALSEPTGDRPHPPGGLTPREVQVAVLVSRGRSNREIADALHISVRTVESHVDHCLTKLGLDNRTQLAAWTRANRLSDHQDEVQSGQPSKLRDKTRRKNP
jgi:predicted ATPase/DNA-binding CsgD family transcriptional regulator